MNQDFACPAQPSEMTAQAVSASRSHSDANPYFHLSDTESAKRAVGQIRDHQARPEDYLQYFGVPSKEMPLDEFRWWAESVTTTVNTQVENSGLVPSQRDLLRHGLARALELLWQEGSYE